MQKFILLLFIFVVGIFNATIAVADDFIVHRAYFEDQTNALTLEQIKQKSFTNYENALTGGYKKGTFWLKLRVRASTQDLALKIRPPYIDQIDLFDPAIGDKKIAGANYPWRNQESMESSSFNFMLPPYATDRDIYLKIKSVQSYLAYVEALPVSQYRHIDRKEQLIYTSFVTFTFILTLWLLVSWIVNPELVLGVFLIQQAIAFVHIFLKVGFARIFLDAYVDYHVIFYIANFSTVLYTLIGLVANRLLLAEYGLKIAYKKAMNLFIASSVLVIALFIADESIALKLNGFLVFTAVILLWFASIFGFGQENVSMGASALPIKVLRMFYSFNWIIWVIVSLPLLGLASMGEAPLYALYIYNILSGLVFFLLLQYRAKSLLRQEMISTSNLKADAEHERSRREEQSMLMAMLSHEIKTPLSVLKLVLDQQVAGSDLERHANRAVNNIDLTINRCLQLGKLEFNKIALHRSQVNCLHFLGEVSIDLKAGNHVQIHGPSDLVVDTDADILRTVVSNLIENALKYSPLNTKINIVVKNESQTGDREGSGVAITISNVFGPIGRPDPAQVFKKYYRNTSATKISGSGLGLFLVHELISVLGGNVLYIPDEKEVTFRLWLPL